MLRGICALSAVGAFLALLGFVGGFAKGPVLLGVLPWTRVTTPRGRWVGGVHAICNVDTGECRRWEDIDCTQTLDATACERCKVQSAAACAPLVVALVTYLFFGLNTWKRYTRRDSNQVKVMSCFAGLFAGLNFLAVLVAYWKTCVRFQALQDDREGSIGVGLVCVGIGAALLKALGGTLHMLLPVERRAAEGPLKGTAGVQTELGEILDAPGVVGATRITSH